jgi:hypothetical protein
MDIYAPAVLNRVVDDLKDTIQTFLLSTFFGEISSSNQEEIWFDVLSGKPRLSPFVSPLVEGQIVQSLGFTTKSFKPAYIKDKRPFEDGKAVRRRPGQQIAAPLDPMQQRLLNLVAESNDQIAMHKRRMEWMAAEVLRTGKVTISGEKYPTTVVDFLRDAALTVTLLTTARWNDSAPDPLGNLESWAGLIRTKSGANAVDVIMAQDVWSVFRANDDVMALLDNNRFSPTTTIDVGPMASLVGATLKGQVGDFRIWIYSDSYVDEAGATQQYLPDNYLLMVSRQLDGVQHFGAIKDEQAGFQPREFFQKSWTMPDPGVRFLMLQSAPLVVPYRVNASLAAKVF